MRPEIVRVVLHQGGGVPRSGGGFPPMWTGIHLPAPLSARLGEIGETAGQVIGSQDLHLTSLAHLGMGFLRSVGLPGKPSQLGQRNPARHSLQPVNQLFLGLRPGILVSIDPEKPSGARQERSNAGELVIVYGG